MLALLVAVVLGGAKLCVAGVVGVLPLPLPGSTAILGHAAGAVLGAGTAPAVGVTTLIKPDALPIGAAIPQYARTFGSFSGSLTGYIRDQWENRDGSYIRGGYTMVDVDGTFVVVEYSSDPINGFRVVVKRQGSPDYFLDSVVLGGPLPGGYLPPFYSDFGFDYSDDYYGYDYDSYYGGLPYEYDYGYVPSYYSSFDYDTYAPTYLNTYDFDLDYDLDYRRRRSVPNPKRA